MSYQVETDIDFDKTLNKLDKPVQKQILKYLKELRNIDDPRSKGKALTGSKRGFWRYRVADYRIICHIQDDKLVVLVLRIGHRSKIYK